MLHPDDYQRDSGRKVATVNLLAPTWSAAVYRSLIDEYILNMDAEDLPEYRIDASGYEYGADDNDPHLRLLLMLQQGLSGRSVIVGELPEGLFGLKEHLQHLRQNLPALAHGDYRSIDVGNEFILAFVRETSYQRCYIVLNFSNRPQRAKLKRIGKWIAGTDLIDGDGMAHTGAELVLGAVEGRLYELRRGDVDVSDL